MVSSEKLKEIYYKGVAGFFSRERVTRSYDKWMNLVTGYPQQINY